MSDDARLTQSAAVFSIIIAAILILGKGVAWVDTDSTSLLASFADSSLDIIVSLINFFAIRFAFSPADKEHPFGHGKAESLAALMQSAFISGSAFVLLLHASERLIHPKPIESLQLAIWVMIISLVLTIVLVMYQRWVYRKTGSLAVKADSAHYFSDILATIAVIAALLGGQWNITWLDPLVAILIVLALLKSAFGIAKEALNMLMDHALDPEVAETIKTLVKGNAFILDCHDIKTRQSGNIQFIQVHLDFSANVSLFHAHTQGEWLVAELIKKYPRADVLIHHDPIEQKDGQANGGVKKA
ncbi:MAG: cation diffusion facilitator family transporter [Oleispira antarctica]|uniref:Predicted Co/Zn/Cd cation transporter n=1 Tax=Oleispira antarctica RB-8 TaxID=698738 RepID=R4YNJ6_OLEAN|nr:cation diffusion facilitator family transporter [Oleispira antarctica]MBQ0792135.1 cation diffusion facilitator family transporter [Oleispira antarctica]CCK76517.1 Predicted Co/Zn/Cd cation transporter [Oleispira antarctica RB-8]